MSQQLLNAGMNKLKSVSQNLAAKFNRRNNQFSKSTDLPRGKSSLNKYELKRKNQRSVHIRQKLLPQEYFQQKARPVSEIIPKPERKPYLKKSSPKPVRYNPSGLQISHLPCESSKKQSFINKLSQVINNEAKTKSGSRVHLNDHNKSASQIEREKQADPFHFEVDSKIYYNRIKTLGSEDTISHKEGARSRSKTITKLHNRSEMNQTVQLSKTVEINPAEEQEKMLKSLIELEQQQINKKSALELINTLNEFKIKASQIHIVDNDDEILDSSKSSIEINNSQIYECEMGKLTKKFLQDWQSINTNKLNTYKHLRNKLISKFPSMRKHYTEYEDHSGQFLQKQQPNQCDISSNKRRESRIESECLQSQGSQDRKGSLHQQEILKSIYKQTYFWSRTKGKKMAVKFSELQEHKREMQNLQKIQKSLTFMKYIKNKSNKSMIMQRSGNIKGRNIIKNHESILQIEKEGSKQQQLLKRCLDNAIEGCIRDNM